MKIRRELLSELVRQVATSAFAWCAWLSIVVFPLCVLIGSAGAQVKAKNALVVFSALSDRAQSFAQVIESETRANVHDPVNFSVVYLNYQRSEDTSGSYGKSMAETLSHKYREMKPDVVIASSIDAIQFAAQYRDEIFPGVPIVFTSVHPRELKDQKLLPGMTGLTTPTGIRETIDLALRLHPDTNAIAIVDVARNFWWNVAHTELLRHQEKVREIDILGSPSRGMLEQIAALPPHTVVLFQLSPQGSTEPAVGAYDVLTAAAEHLPTYSAWDRLCFDHGCIGGVYPDWRRIAQSTGAIAARVLSGARPEDLPIAHDTDFQVQVDWWALQRWHITESALPTGSVILNRPPSFWGKYRKHIIAYLALIVALASLLVGLLWQRARTQKANVILREAEDRFHVMADTTPSLIWMCDQHGKMTYLNERRLAYAGPDMKERVGESWITSVHPDDVEGILDSLSQALTTRQPFSKEYRLKRQDQVYRWMFDVASPWMKGDGSFGGFIGSAIDVTDQKLAQQALEKVSGQLIEAQEKERSRIARDLHDDICQRLALLSMKIDQANQSSNGSAIRAKERLDEIRDQCAEIAGDVQSLAHQLHSSSLDFLGLVVALRVFCNELSTQHEVKIVFTDRNVPEHLAKDISLCLFRVAQEAVHNALKYSGTGDFFVEISSSADEVRLEVSDMGAGFDIEEVRKNGGLGLVSMQERVNLVHGRLTVESQHGMGTKILATVPLVVEGGLFANRESMASDSEWVAR